MPRDILVIISYSHYLYTLSVKRTCHFFRATLTKIHAIKINNIWTHKNIWKTQDFLASNRRKMWLITKGNFSKTAETAHRASSTEAAYSEHSIAIHSISMEGYVNAVRAIVCFELPTREASNFCDFWKLTSCDFMAFISSLIEVNFFFFLEVLIKDKYT